MANKITKSQLQKQVAEMQAEKNTLIEMISRLEKENAELKVKVSFYENLPQNVCNTIGGGIDFILKSAFPKEQQRQ